MNFLPLPTTVEVSANGAVSIDFPERTVAMSRFSPRAQRLAHDFGVGTHVIRTFEDAEDLPFGVIDDLAEALA